MAHLKNKEQLSLCIIRYIRLIYKVIPLQSNKSCFFNPVNLISSLNFQACEWPYWLHFRSLSTATDILQVWECKTKHFQDKDDCQLKMEAQIVLAPNSKPVILDSALSVSHPKESLPSHYLPFLLSILLLMKVAGIYLIRAQNHNHIFHLIHYTHQQLLKPDGPERLWTLYL